MNHLGFIGSRIGMSREQKKVANIIIGGTSARYIHHRDYQGTDQQIHDLADMKCHKVIIVHPGNINGQRAFCPVAIGRHLCPMPSLARNVQFVKDIDCLIIMLPSNNSVEIGTSTDVIIQTMKKAGKPIVLVRRDGTIG